MTSKTLTDPDGDTIVIGGRTPDDVYVSITQGAALAVVRGIPTADLIAAIREVTGTPVPAPSTPPTVEDFAAARFAEVDGKPAVHIKPVGGGDTWAARHRGGWWWGSDSDMATLARDGRARIVREAPTDPATLIDLAWEAAHPVPEGVRVPPHTPCMERSDDGRITFAPDGFSFDADAHGTGWEIRTLGLAPLPTPRPEGAEELEAVLRDFAIHDHDGQEYPASLADCLARRGVRVSAEPVAREGGA